jgi:hypothetical protein
MSGRVYQSTNSALSALRRLSYDEDEVLLESLVSPIFEVLGQCSSAAGEAGMLNTVVLPALHRIIRDTKRVKGDARISVFMILFDVWRRNLIDVDGEPLDTPTDPFCKRSKWFVSTALFAELVVHCGMTDLFHRAIFDSVSDIRESMENELRTSSIGATDEAAVRQLLMLFSRTLDVPVHAQVNECDGRLENMNMMGIEPVSTKSEVDLFLEALVDCATRESVLEKLRSAKKEHFLELLDNLLSSQRFERVRKSVILHEDWQVTQVERDVISVLNRLTSNNRANVTTRVATKFIHELLPSILSAPSLVYRRLLCAAGSHASQAAIIFTALRFFPALAHFKATNKSPTYLLLAFRELVWENSDEYADMITPSAMMNLCDELFDACKSEKSRLIDAGDAILWIVLPILASVHASGMKQDSSHSIQLMLAVLSHVITTGSGEMDGSFVRDTHPASVLMHLARTRDFCLKNNLVTLQTICATLMGQIVEGLLETLAKVPLTRNTASILRSMDLIAAGEIGWDTRLILEPVVRHVRWDASMAPTPPSMHGLSTSGLIIDILTLYALDASDQMLVELLQALQSDNTSLHTFRSSLLVACAHILPAVSSVQFEKISRMGLPTLLKMRVLPADEIPISLIVLDIVCRSMIFVLKYSPRRAFTICRHFTQLASDLFSGSQMQLDTDLQSVSMIRAGFSCICRALEALGYTQKFDQWEACEVSLLSSALVCLQILKHSRSHKQWCLRSVRALPAGLTSKKQLEKALQ